VLEADTSQLRIGWASWKNALGSKMQDWVESCTRSTRRGPWHKKYLKSKICGEAKLYTRSTRRVTWHEKYLKSSTTL